MTSWIVDVPCIYGGGAGEPNDPFQIWSAEHLVSIGYCPDDFNSCYALMTDIDLNDIDPNWIVPIGTVRWPFRGSFDGNAHIISNLTCLSEGQSCVGLFGFLEDRHSRFYHDFAIVKNLHLANAIIHGGHLTGALVGKNEGQIVTCSITGVVNGRDKTGGLVGSNEGTADNCHYTGSVYGETGVGGICGQNGSHGRLELCSASGTVTDIENVGGLLGSNYGIRSVAVSCQASSHVSGINQVGGFAGYNGSNLQESHSTGNVTGQTNIGGFVGMNSDDVRACKSSGSVSGDTSVGGFVGYNSRGAITSCYTGSDVTGDNAIGGLVGQNGKGTSRMMQSHTFRGWAETGTWTILEGIDYPRLVWEKQAGEPITKLSSSYGGGKGDPNDPYQIWTCEQFVEIAHRPEDFMKCFVLMADIDMAELDSYEIIPIGSYEVPFIGLFNGNGHTISNFRCVCPRSPYAGVFGVLGWSGHSSPSPPLGGSVRFFL